MRIDYTLCLVTDRRLLAGRTLEEAVEQAVLGGCTMVQLREKEGTDLELFRQAEAAQRAASRWGVPLIVNDRVDIALAVGAAGVHVGQRDLPPAAVRWIAGGELLLGVSVSSAAQAVRAVEAGADYLGVGAMFPTGTKGDADLVSLEELGKIRRAVDVPLLVIGGICRENAGLFRAMGVDGLAAASAIMGRGGIRSAAAGLREDFEDLYS